MLYHDRAVFGTVIKEVDKVNVTTASIISLSNRSIIPWKTSVENPSHSTGVRKMTSCGLPGFTVKMLVYRLDQPLATMYIL